MNQAHIIELTCKYVQNTLKSNSSCHDWWHAKRVWKLAQYIATQEQANCYIVELAALLHDIADWKFHGGDESKGTETAHRYLRDLSVETGVIEQVCHIIQSLSFRGAHVKSDPLTLEGQIVQDSDRLDAIGAIGIARAFTYGGYKHRSIYHPNSQPQLHHSFEQYKNHEGTTINHFHEKLLLLKDRMNTATGKKLAIQKHQFMEQFLKQFSSEWEMSCVN